MALRARYSRKGKEKYGPYYTLIEYVDHKYRLQSDDGFRFLVSAYVLEGFYVKVYEGET